MKISVNVPSYKRADKLLTPKYLPYSKVWVDHKEAEEYKRLNPDVQIVSCPEGVQGNVARIRNYILREELRGGADVVVMLDDDLHYIERFEFANGYAYNKYKLNADEVLQMIYKYSIMAEEIGAKFWGVNCNPDAMSYRQYTPFSTTCFVGGPFQCFLKGNRCWYDETLPLKEDYDMTLQQLNRERIVLRVNSYHYICEQSTNVGGCAAMRNRTREKEQFDAFQKKWGSKIVKRDTTNKGRSEKVKPDDYNPIVKAPIKGV